MKKHILILLSLSIFLGVLIASPAYYANRYLFSLESTEPLLTQEQMETLETPYPELNKLIKKFDVVKIEPWLSNARPDDRDGDVYLNRIYRLITQQDQPAPLSMAADIMKTTSSIQNAEPEAIMRKLAIPDDPGIGNQYYLTKAQVQEAWKLWDLEGGEVPGSKDIVVAVVDDGVEYTHPDLWKNIWINQDEIPSIYFPFIDADGDGYVTPEEAVNSLGEEDADLRDVLSSRSLLTDDLDTDGDGYVDNIIGWDTEASGGISDDDKDPMVTNNSHGTHVAGLVGATTNNGVGIASAAYNISVMAVKSTGDETTNSINTGWDGILYAAQAGANIINCSWGGPGYSSYAQNIVNNVYNNYGAMIVAAAGNGDDENGGPTDEPHYPSGYDNVVSVTAVSAADVFSWANYGAADPSSNFYGVDIAAPGESMLSTYLTKDYYYAYLNGTSMASPFVASCFALLKSVYPDSTNDWLIDRMLSNTDPIDDINPDYAGQLGTGRVNILKALASDILPKLSLSESIYTISDGDPDSILNPGESINLMIELKNDTGWTNAANIQGVLRSSTEGIDISDSVAFWTSIPQNTAVMNDSNGFEISFSEDLLPGNYGFTLKLESPEEDEFQYRKTISFTVSLYLDQQGFPFYASTEVEAPPVFMDLDDDEKQEIIFTDKNGQLYIVDYLGNVRDGFPVTLSSQPRGIAVSDIDLDGTMEIVASLFDKEIVVYDVDGNYEWSRHTDLFNMAIPAIGNLDSDPELEVVVGSYDQKLYVLNHDSTDVGSSPYSTGQMLHSGVSLADINGDDLDDIIYGSKTGQLNILLADGSQYSNFPVMTSGSISSEPQVIKTPNDSIFILIGNDNGDMYGFDLNGDQKFMIEGNGAVYSSPALYVREDVIYAFFGTNQGNIYKINLNNGSLETNWPVHINAIYQSLILADVLDDGIDEPQVIALGNNGYLYAFDMEGGGVNGFPINTRYLSKSSPVICDIDNDGDNELIAGQYSGISVIDLKESAGNIYWSMHRGSADRKGAIVTTWTGIQSDVIPNGFQLIGNMPNPFNPRTKIKYYVAKESPAELKIYSLNGKLIATQRISNPFIGLNEINLNMDDYSSGIYLYTLEQAGEFRSSKMILLK